MQMTYQRNLQIRTRFLMHVDHLQLINKAFSWAVWALQVTSCLELTWLRKIRLNDCHKKDKSTYLNVVQLPAAKKKATRTPYQHPNNSIEYPGTQTSHATPNPTKLCQIRFRISAGYSIWSAVIRPQTKVGKVDPQKICIQMSHSTTHNHLQQTKKTTFNSWINSNRLKWWSITLIKI